MKKIIFILLLVFTQQAYCQKEAYHWYFGTNTGLDFSNTHTESTSLGNVLGVPSTVQGPISTFEGCFSISDKDGNFLFASDGITVYNKNLVTMQNGTGLLGHPSSTNSGIVIPVPDNPSLYYIVTAPDRNNTAPGLCYSTVNMSANGGLGAVVLKNVSLTFGSSGYPITHAYENLTAVGHANGKDYWVVSRVRSKIFAWLITSTGINVIPVISEIGMDLGIPTIAPSSIGVGTTKISPDGKRIIHADYRFDSNHYLTIGNFDTSTGKASSFQFISTYLENLYSLEFSPTANYLYFTAIERGDRGLYMKPINNISAPFTRILPNANIDNVQLGPDNRIYAIGNQQSSLWIILDPDNGGTQIAEVPNKFISPRLPRLGLPPFITSFFNIKPIKGKEIVCVGNSAEYSVEIPSIGSGTQQIAYLEWNFGDGTPVVKDYNMSSSITTYKQSHTYNIEGVYTIRVTPYLVNGLAESSKITTITNTVSECKVVTNRMIRSDLLPN